MNSSKDALIVSSIIQEPSSQHYKVGCGLIIRFGFHAWKGNHWKTHQTVMQANTVLLNLIELQNPAYISRSVDGCEAVFEDSTSLIQTAILLQSCIQKRSFPATIVLYKDQAHLESSVWISSMERQAEHIAYWGNDREILMMPSIKEGLSLPIGIGMLPASKNMQKIVNMPLWTLHVYQDD